MSEDIYGVPVEVERGESGAYFVTSPEMEGLHVTRMAHETALHDTTAAIAALFAADGMHRAALTRLDDKALLRMHDDIHGIMEMRAVDIKREIDWIPWHGRGADAPKDTVAAVRFRDGTVRADVPGTRWYPWGENGRAATPDDIVAYAPHPSPHARR